MKIKTFLNKVLSILKVMMKKGVSNQLQSLENKLFKEIFEIECKNSSKTNKYDMNRLSIFKIISTHQSKKTKFKVTIIHPSLILTIK